MKTGTTYLFLKFLFLLFEIKFRDCIVFDLLTFLLINFVMKKNLRCIRVISC